MDKFYFTGYFGKKVEELHFADLQGAENVSFLSKNYCGFSTRWLGKYFSYCHQWKKIDTKEPRFAHFWNHFYELNTIKFDKKDKHYVIFLDSALTVCYSETFFEDFKRKNPHVKLIMYLVDQMDRWYSARIRRMLPYFDWIYAINHLDCQKYGFTYYPLVYSNYPLKHIQTFERPSDIYFMGNNSDRNEFLQQLYCKFDEEGIVCDFNIVGVPEEKQKYKEKIRYNCAVDMQENLSHCLATNCILEIMHKTVQAVTARYPEAVYLNRKLLTNNKEVIKEKFYNPQYVQIFDKIEDIDFQWIKEKQVVDYGYTDEFSPKHFLERIKVDLQ